jgi:hypothetical protein
MKGQPRAGGAVGPFFVGELAASGCVAVRGGYDL